MKRPLKVTGVSRHAAALFPKTEAMQNYQQQPPHAGIKPTPLVAFGLNDLLGGAAPTAG